MEAKQMPAENKYYTPTIEEFHVGFEFEYLGSVRNTQWLKMTLNKDDFKCLIYDYGHEMDGKFSELYRVKCLDRDDIESLGWKYTGRSIDQWFEINGDFDMGSWYSRKAQMHYGLHDNRLYIQMYDTGVLGPNVFQGTIKNKSEFIVLMKQLKLAK